MEPNCRLIIPTRWHPALGLPDFIKTLYQNILDRDPEDQHVIQHWTQKTISNGLTSTINGFFVSEEFKGRNHPPDAVVDKLYRAILGREPTGAEGKAYWLRRLERGDAMQTIIGDFMKSPEYCYKIEIGVVPNPAIHLWDFMLGIPDFVRTLYHNVLDRNPDRAESQFMITHWTKHTVTHDLATTINEFFVSDEFLGKNHSLDAMVHRLFRSILGREPEIEEKNHWLDRLKQADVMHIVIDQFIASPEYRYKAKIGAAPNPAICFWHSSCGLAEFVRTLYRNILDRDPESKEAVQFWTTHSTTHGLASTLNGFLTSDEFKSKNHPPEAIVDRLYRSILSREPEADGKAHWLGRLGSGDKMEVIISRFLDCPEYRGNVQKDIAPDPLCKGS